MLFRKVKISLNSCKISYISKISLFTWFSRINNKINESEKYNQILIKLDKSVIYAILFSFSMTKYQRNKYQK
jgi:hypothetical protein